MLSPTGDCTSGLICDILPINPYTTRILDQNYREGLDLPFTQDTIRDSKLRRVISEERSKQSIEDSNTDPSDSETDDVVREAIRSISVLDYKENAIGSSNRKVQNYSHREKSIRLLRKCPIWSQLDGTRKHRIRLEGRGKHCNCRGV